MTGKKEEMKKKVESKKKEALKKAEVLDRNVRNLDKIAKANKIIYYAEKHIKLCKAVIEKNDKLFKAQTGLWDADSAGLKPDIEKYKKQVEALKKDFKKAKIDLLEQKKKYEDKDLKKDLRGLSKIPAFLKEDYNNN